MGCSNSTPLDADAMLEKQRQLMLQKQREFEQRRAATANSREPSRNGASTEPGSASEGRRPSKEPRATTPVLESKPPSKSDLKPAPSEPPRKSNLERDKNAEKSLEPAKGAQEPVAAAVSAPDFAAEPDDLALSAEVRRKYTIDPAEDEKRKSKNLHDMNIYGKKDFARRASLNPQSIVQLAEPAPAPTPSPPAASFESSKLLVDDVIIEETGSRWTVVDGEKKPEAAAIAPPPPQEGDGDTPTIDPELVNKHLARNPEDRKSKNIHDLKLYMGKTETFARRASYVPPPILPQE